MSKNALTILYIEDEESDRFFMKRAFEAADLGASLKLLRNGKEALEYLQGAGVYQDRTQSPEPHLILLDLKLPLVSGFEVLAWIRQQPRYASVPVVVFSSSWLEQDRARAKYLGASEYFEKPNSGTLYSMIVHMLQKKWLPARAKGDKGKTVSGTWMPETILEEAGTAREGRLSSPVGTILLADDSEDDELFFRRMLRIVGVENPLQVVRDGKETIAYMKGEDVYADRALFPLPSILFLDLLMPGMDGWEVLKWLQTRPDRDSLYVVVLTGPMQQMKLNEAYAMGTDSFLTKPIKKAELEALTHYWPELWKIAKPPPSPGGDTRPMA